MKNIAIQQGLTPVRDYLSGMGYRVQEFDNKSKADTNFFNSFDAVVITGLDDNVMGIQNTTNKIPFIEAKGMTPQAIKGELDKL